MGGSEKSFDPKDACKKEACVIQTCLSRNAYNMQRCQWAVDALQRCCEEYHGISVHCAMVKGTGQEKGAE